MNTFLVRLFWGSIFSVLFRGFSLKCLGVWVPLGATAPWAFFHYNGCSIFSTFKIEVIHQNLSCLINVEADVTPAVTAFCKQNDVPRTQCINPHCSCLSEIALDLVLSGTRGIMHREQKMETIFLVSTLPGCRLEHVSFPTTTCEFKFSWDKFPTKKLTVK